MIKLIKKILNKFLGGKKMREIKIGDNLSGVMLKIKDGLTFEKLNELMTMGWATIDFNNGETIDLIKSYKDDMSDEYNYKLTIHIGDKSINRTLFSEDKKNLAITELYIPLQYDKVKSFSTANNLYIQDDPFFYEIFEFDGNHSQVNVICNNLCLEEGITKKQAINELSNYISKANFAIVEGELVLPSDEFITGDSRVDYPNGFKQDNCIIISILATSDLVAQGWNTPADATSPAYIRGCSDVCAQLLEDKIRVIASKVVAGQPSKTIIYRIVLMKIN